MNAVNTACRLAARPGFTESDLGMAASFAGHAADSGWGPGELALQLGLVGALVLLLSGGDLNEWSLYPFYSARLRSAFVDMLDRLNAQEGRAEAAFTFFLRKRAPVSGIASLLDYQGR